MSKHLFILFVFFFSHSVMAGSDVTAIDIISCIDTKNPSNTFKAIEPDVFGGTVTLHLVENNNRFGEFGSLTFTTTKKEFHFIFNASGQDFGWILQGLESDRYAKEYDVGVNGMAGGVGGSSYYMYRFTVNLPYPEFKKISDKDSFSAKLELVEVQFTDPFDAGDLASQVRKFSYVYDMNCKVKRTSDSH